MQDVFSRIRAVARSVRPAHRIMLLYAILLLVVVMSTLGEGISQILAASQSVLVALAAIGGVIVAAEGLDTWHKQIRGRTDYDLAMKIGKDVIHLRDLLCSAGLMSVGGQVSNNNYSGVELIVSWKNPKYIDDIHEAMEQLSTNRTEAELLWGEEAHKVITALLQLAFELTNYIGYLESQDDEKKKPIGFEAPWHDAYKDKRNPVAGSETKEDNEFQREVKREAKAVRQFLGKFLGPGARAA
jgi:hypothetical protein